MAAFWIDWAIRSSVLMALGLAAAGLMRQMSAKHRHVLLVVVLLASAMLPAISALFNIHELNVLPWEKAAAGIVTGAQVTSASPSLDLSWLAFLLFVIPAVLIVRMGAIWLRLSQLSQRTQKRGALNDVAIHISDDPRIKTAMTWGWLQPRIVMPAIAHSWPKDRMASVLQHEMAHIYRRDWATQQLAFCAVSFLWYNPLAWMTLRRILLEAERAADDLVIQNGIAPAEYAQHLLDSARNLTRKQQTAYAGVHTTKNGNLECRLRYILDPECRLRCQASLPILTTLGLAAALTPLLLVRLEGQATAQTATQRQTRTIRLVASREKAAPSEGGITLSCSESTAKSLPARLKSQPIALSSKMHQKQAIASTKQVQIVASKRPRRSLQAISRIELGNRTSSGALASSASYSSTRTDSVTVVLKSSPALLKRPTMHGHTITITSSPSTLTATKKGDNIIFGVVAETDSRSLRRFELSDRPVRTFRVQTQTKSGAANQRKVINVVFDRGIMITEPPSIVDEEKTEALGKAKLIASSGSWPVFAFAFADTIWLIA